MAVKTKTVLKEFFQTGDKPTQEQFHDLIDSLQHVSEESSGTVNTTTVNATTSVTTGNVYATNIEATNKITAISGAFQHITASLIDVDANTIRIGGSSFSKTDVDELKEVEAKRKSDDGIPIKRLRSFEGSSTFIDMNRSSVARQKDRFGNTLPKGTSMDVFVKDNYEAFHIDPYLVSIGPKPNIPIELTGSINTLSDEITLSATNTIQILGSTTLAGSTIINGGDTQIVGNTSLTGGDTIIEEGIIVQPGVISQSLNIGTTTSPSINIMDGVGDSCFIKIAEGITVRVNDGSLFKIQCPQPDITVDPDVGTVTISDVDEVGNDVVIYNNNNGNPTTVLQNTTIPAGQVSYWTVGDTENGLGIIINEGFSLRIEDGAILHVQNAQPDITVNTEEDTITLSNGTGDETSFTTGQFGTNPQMIPMHMVVPSNQIAVWYGPIYVGRFTLNPLGTEFNPNGAGVLNMDLAGQGNNASLRIHNGAQIKVHAF